MRSFKLSTLGAVMLLLSPGAASAAGFYLGAQGGMNLSYDADLGGFGELSYDPGVAVGFDVGYKWPFNLRTEIELAIRANDADSFAGFPVADGTLWSVALMSNLFYDFDTGSDWIPYVGGGLGVASLDFDSGTEGDGVFAYQIGTGIGYALSPSVIVSLDYRLFGTSDADLNSSGFGPSLDLEYLNSTFLLGLRYQF